MTYVMHLAIMALSATLMMWCFWVALRTRSGIMVTRRPIGFESDNTIQIIHDDQLTIGRSVDSSIRWNSDNISRVHVVCFRGNDQQWYANHQGRESTQLNGRNMERKENVPLKYGDVLKAGNHTCRIVFPSVSVPPAQWSVSIRRRTHEGATILAVCGFLAAALAAIDSGRRLDYPESLRVFAPESTITVVGIFTVGWLAIWSLNCLVEHARYHAFVVNTHQHTWYSRPQTILPAVSMLMAFGAMVTHRTDTHVLYVGQPLDVITAGVIRTPGMMLTSIGALIACIGVAWFIEYIYSSHATSNTTITNTRHYAMRFVNTRYYHVCSVVVRRIPHWGRMNAVAQELIFQRHVLIMLIGPVIVVIMAMILGIGEQLGIVQRVGGQIVQAFALQPAEVMRLLLSASMVIVASQTLIHDMRPAVNRSTDFVPITGFIVAVLSALVYLVISRESGMVLLAILTALAIISLTLRQRTWLVLLGTVGFATAVFWSTSVPLSGTDASSPLGRRIQQAYQRPAIDMPVPSDPLQADPYTSPECVICPGDQELRQVAYAIIAGGTFGMGPGRGLITPPAPVAPYVSAAFSDYAMAVVLEEYGLVGLTAVWMVLLLLTVHAFWLGQHLSSPWWRTIAVAAAMWWSLQTLIVMLGMLRMLPFAGLPIPYVSFGRTSALLSGFVVCLMLVASQMPRIYANELLQTHQFGFGFLNSFMRTGFVTVFAVISLGFILNPFSRDYQLVNDVRTADTVNVASSELEALKNPRNMGNRVLCQVYRQPLHEIVTRGAEITLFEPVPDPLGCRVYALPSATPMMKAQSLGIDRVLQDLLIGSSTFMQRIVDGRLELTIDERVQRAVVQLVDAGLGAADGEPWAQAVVMDADGRILALVDRSFQADSRGYQRFQWRWYSPGSIMKVVTSIIALQAGLTTEDAISCNSVNYPEDVSVKNSLGAENCRYAGEPTDLAHALAYSVNTAFVNLTDVASSDGSANSRIILDVDEYIRAAERLGFGEIAYDTLMRGGVEQRPIVLAPYANESLPIISASLGTDAAGMARVRASIPTWADTVYGQANTSMTVVHAAALMQLIANDGRARTPRLFEPVAATPWEQSAMLDRGVARTMQQLLSATVNIPLAVPMVHEGVQYRLAGAAASIRDGEQLVAGKTGTAERSGQRPVQWFAGYAQTLDQTYIVAVVMSQELPHDVGQCSPAAVAGTIFDALLGVADPRTCGERGR